MEKTLSLEPSVLILSPIILTPTPSNPYPDRCLSCSMKINSEGSMEQQRCFLCMTRSPLRGSFGGKDLPLFSMTHDHRVFVETTPDFLSELYTTTGMLKSFQEWHDSDAPTHPMCSSCGINRPFLVGFGRR